MNEWMNGLQAMDLRWGIREQSHDDHTIIEFCLREIENCKRTSVGPTFVVSLFPSLLSALQLLLLLMIMTSCARGDTICPRPSPPRGRPSASQLP